MTRGILWSIIGGALLVCSTAAPSAAVEFEVDPSAAWLGYMNVFELPENGMALAFGSPWGTADLVSEFSGSTLTLAPNTIGDPDPYWYTPVGEPGATGNKWMDANLYVELTDTLGGQLVTFSGTVVTNSFQEPYSTRAFIRDFAPDYSSFEFTEVLLAPGEFSITLDAIDEPGRHVQYGFNTQGPNVWFTDVEPLGTITIATVTPVGQPGDYNNDTVVDAADYTVWRDNLGSASALPFNDDTVGVDQDDYDRWKTNFGLGAGAGAPAATAVPEPGSAVLLLSALMSFVLSRRGTSK